MRALLSIVAALCFAWPAFAHEYLVGDLLIVHPITRPTPPGATVAGGYMEHNGGAEPEQLLAIRTDIADTSFFDRTAMDGAGARLGTPIDIRRGRLWCFDRCSQIRFSELEAPLRIGDKFVATLVFANQGAVSIEFWVEGGLAVTAPIFISPEQADPEDVAQAAIYTFEPATH